MQSDCQVLRQAHRRDVHSLQPYPKLQNHAEIWCQIHLLGTQACHERHSHMGISDMMVDLASRALRDLHSTARLLPSLLSGGFGRWSC